LVTGTISLTVPAAAAAVIMMMTIRIMIGRRR
jgi:hypothetical protein